MTESMGASGGSARDGDNAAGRAPGSKRPEFFERLRDGRGRTGLPESSSTPAQSVRQKKRKKRELPPQSEIARIYCWCFADEVTLEKEVQKKVLKKEGGFLKPPIYETVTETVTETVKETRGYFWAQAVGSQGVYSAGMSPKFKYSQTYVVRSRYSGEYQVDRDDNSQAALNALLSQLWSEGWQPTSWGQFWYDFRLRRAVVNSERSSPRVPSPREPSEATGRL